MAAGTVTNSRRAVKKTAGKSAAIQRFIRHSVVLCGTFHNGIGGSLIIEGHRTPDVQLPL